MFRSEREMEDAFITFLQRKKVQVQRQISCLVGIADVVTLDVVYEIKRKLTPSRAFHAAAQAISYRNALAPTAKAIVLTDAIVKRQAIQRAVLVGASVYLWDGAAAWPRAQGVFRSPIQPYGEHSGDFLHDLKLDVVRMLQQQPGIRLVDLEAMYSADGGLPWWESCLSDLENDQRIIYWPNEFDHKVEQGLVRCWYHGGLWKFWRQVHPPVGVVPPEFLAAWPSSPQQQLH